MEEEQYSLFICDSCCIAHTTEEGRSQCSHQISCVQYQCSTCGKQYDSLLSCKLCDHITFDIQSDNSETEQHLAVKKESHRRVHFWHQDTTSKLVELVAKNYSKLCDKRCKKAHVWKDIWIQLKFLFEQKQPAMKFSFTFKINENQDSSLTHEQVTKKWTNLVQAYKKYLQNMKTTGAAPQRLPEFFVEINAILGDQQSISPKFTTSVGLTETANALSEVPDDDEILSVEAESIVQPSTSQSNIEVVAPLTKRRSADKTMKEMLILNEKFLEVEKEKVNLMKSNVIKQREEEIETQKILRDKRSSNKLLISVIENQNKKLDKLENLLNSMDGRLQNIEKVLNL
ncbi:UNVERIFIED_CONTAM: hypothetical protein RMT77_016971 [Armadillidium vulgare]